MGLLDNIKQQIGSQFIEIIQWLDDTNDSLVYRFPVYNQEIKMNAQLTVRENQVALFINEGKAADLFVPGRYQLTTQNMPILTTLRGWKYGFQSPFKAEVYFFNTRLFTDLKWGTTNPVMMRDAEFGMIRLRAFGTYAMKIADAEGVLRGDRRHAGPHDDGRDHGPAPLDDPLAPLGRDRRVEDRRARPRVEVRRALRARQEILAPEFAGYGLELVEVLHREHLAARGGRGRDRPAHEARRPRRQDGPVHAAPGRGRDEDRGGESGRRRGGRHRHRRRHRDGRHDGRARSGRAWRAPARRSDGASAPPRARGFAAPKWSLTVDGKTYGPYTDDALKGMVSAGQVAPGTLAWKPGAASWAPALDVRGVRGPSGAPPPPMPPPPSHALIAIP